MSERWRIEQLQAVVRDALQAAGIQGPESKRVRAVPDTRTIRYYTTLGILDRPLELRGRTALYGRRHVLQLVGIKRLQAEGLTLSQVQQRLAGASDRQLRGIAGLPAEFWQQADEPSESSGKDGRDADVAPAFWAAPAAAADPPRPAAVLPAVRLPLAGGVQLELTGVEPRDLEAALPRLAPLLQQLAMQLRQLGLTSDDSPELSSPSESSESSEFSSKPSSESADERADPRPEET